MKHANKGVLPPFMRRAGLLLVSLFLSLTTIYAQSTLITGQVVDETGEPIIGANVLEKGTMNGVITDIDGNYSLSLTNSQTAVLQFSYIGYTTVEETVGTRTSIDIQLAPSVINLGEVVAIGYGTQTRREITGSVANITSESFNQGVTRDATDLMQGKVAGLSITQTSGDLTENSVIRLRGVNTLQKDNGPFIVIDGVPGGELSSVSPQDIESISVLKDASSAAIYGSRSAGGVILITTKRGSGSRTSISYDGYVAISNSANTPRMLTAGEWRQYVSDNNLQEQAASFDQYGADTNWFDQIMRTGISQNHSVSMSGGGSKHNYRASVNYQNLEGIMKDNNMEKINFRFQFSQRAINDRLKLGMTGSATIDEGSPSAKVNTVLASNFLPVYPVHNQDGSWFDLTEWLQGNPLRQIEKNTRNRKIQDFYGNVDVEFDFIPSELTSKLTLYKRRKSYDYSEYNDSETYSGRDPKGYAKRESDTLDRDLLEWTVNYQKDLAKGHKINLLGGYSWEESNYQRLMAQNRFFVTNNLGANNLQSGQDLRPEDVESEKYMYRMISFFARANYSYKERYMLTATVRRDGSSKFGANHKWGTFPSASAAWGISQEDFMKEVSWLDDLKLRVGYGVTGNQDGLDPYKTLELYGKDGTYYDTGNWYASYKISQNANPNLKWEQTSAFNVGLDFEIFKGRLGGTVEWYRKNTSDMLYEYTVPTPPFLHDKMMANVGNMLNQGFEFVLNASIIRNKDFSWNMSANGAFNHNEVTKLSNALYSTERIYVGDVGGIRGMSATSSSIIEVGYPVGQFYGLKCLGIENGKFIMDDLDGDGEATDADRTYIGSPQPKFTFGWHNSFNYKNWDLSMFFRGTVGNDVMNIGRISYSNLQSLIGANVRKEALEIGLNQAPQLCSYYVEDGSHIRLDNVAIGYTFKTDKINWLNNARVYATAQNLFVITGYKGLDPEVKMDGVDPGKEEREFYPKARTFSVGVSLNF